MILPMTISPKNWPLKAGAFSLLAAAALAGVDQALKIWATAALQPVGSAQLLPCLLYTSPSPRDRG